MACCSPVQHGEEGGRGGLGCEGGEATEVLGGSAMVGASEKEMPGEGGMVVEVVVVLVIVVLILLVAAVVVKSEAGTVNTNRWQ